MDSLNSKPDGDIALTNGNDLAPVHLPKAKPPNTQQELSIEFFRNFLVYLGQKYMELLQEHPDDEAAYRVFLEVIYCRMYLLNRPLARRIERLRLSDLEPRNNNHVCRGGTKRFPPHDKLLAKTLKKLTLRERPAWFSEDMRPAVEFFLAVRGRFFPPGESPSQGFVFALPGEERLNGRLTVEKISDYAVLAYALEHPEVVAGKLFPEA